jgi:hypothetical protein
MALFKTPEEREAARATREQQRKEEEVRAAAQRAEAERQAQERRRREGEHVATLDIYEYRVFDTGGGDRAVTERGSQQWHAELNELARSGWRVVSTVVLETDRGQTSSTVTVRFILERRAPA